MKGHARLLEAVRAMTAPRGRVRLPEAQEAAACVSRMLASPASPCRRHEMAGELRRACETVHGLQVVAVCDRADDLLEHCLRHEAVLSASRRDDRVVSLLLLSAMTVDIHVATPATFAATLVAVTGNAEHLAELAARAAQRGLQLTGDALLEDGQPLDVGSERDLYGQLGLATIPPELREGRGEVTLAAANALPTLVAHRDLLGLLHVHTVYSDGEMTIREVAEDAREHGFEYIGISDHSQSAFYAGGLTPEAVARQHREIDALNQEFAPFRIFKGIESDILADGALDYEDSVLATFDFVIASVHSRLNLPREEMTRRVVGAVLNPFTTVLGHPSGRLLLSRPGIELDMDRVLAAAGESGTAVELNTNPYRLDLDWRHHTRARELGIAIPINPDAHTRDGLASIGFGVAVARKGGLTPADVLTCWDVEAVNRFFRRKRP